MDESGVEDASFENVAVGRSPYTPLGTHDFATLLDDEDRRGAVSDYGSPYLGQAHAGEDAAAFGDPDLAGISEVELDQQCVDLFTTTPIKFLPRRSSDLDNTVAEFIRDLELTIPI